MVWDFTLKITDIAIVISTVSGPVLAVQAQKWLERRRDIKGRQLTVYRVLMATRAQLLSPGHVEAINAVPVEFWHAGKKSGKLRAINDAWQLYMDCLEEKDANPAIWSEKRRRLLIDMLFKMGLYLGYDFNLSQVEKVYAPIGHAEIEMDQTKIRQGLVKILNGELSLPMSVRELPTDEGANLEQLTIRKLLTEWLRGDRTVKVAKL